MAEQPSKSPLRKDDLRTFVRLIGFARPYAWRLLVGAACSLIGGGSIVAMFFSGQHIPTGEVLQLLTKGLHVNTSQNARRWIYVHFHCSILNFSFRERLNLPKILHPRISGYYGKSIQ